MAIKQSGVNQDLTELVFVVDKSGSMCGLEDDTVGGLNSVLEENRKADGEAIVSIVEFDNSSEVIVDRTNLRDVRPLSRKDYRVGGCTALLDAVGDAIRHTARVQGYMPDGHKAGKVMFVIITDGQENASRRRTYAEVKQMIEESRSAGWEFVFLGANIDAAAEAARMGIPRAAASEYVSDGMGTAVAYEAVACATRAVRSCGSLPSEWGAGLAADVRERGGRK
jgi:Mg-chelatase subunit ChlD